MSDNSQSSGGSGDLIRTIAKTVNSPTKTQMVVLDVGGGADASGETAWTGGVNLNDGTGAAINSLAAGTGQNGLMVAMGATNFYYSTVNTTSTQLTSGATFAGAIESALNEPAVSVNLYSDQPGTFVIYQYLDAGGLYLIDTWPISVPANTGLNFSKALNGNYARFAFTNNGTATTTKFSQNIAYGTIPPATQLGNNPNALNEVNGTTFNLGQNPAALSLPVVIASNQTAVSTTDTSLAAAQSNDSTVFVTDAGDPNGDFAGLNLLEQVLDPTTGQALSVQVVNPSPSDSTPGSNKGNLPADGATYIIGSGQQQIIDTTGYVSATIHSIGAIATISQGNIPGTLVAVNNIIVSNGGAIGATVTSGAIGYMPCTARFVKVSMGVASGAMVIIVLRTTPCPIYSNANGTMVSGTIAVGNAVAQNPISLAWDGTNARRILTDASLGGLVLGSNAGANGQSLIKVSQTVTTPASTVIKSSGGRITMLQISSGAAVAGYLHLYNAVSVTLGTTSDAMTFAVPAAVANYSIMLPDGGLNFGTGICAAFTAGSAANDNTSFGSAPTLILNGAYI